MRKVKEKKQKIGQLLLLVSDKVVAAHRMEYHTKIEFEFECVSRE